MNIADLPVGDRNSPGKSLFWARLGRGLGFSIPHISYPNRRCMNCGADAADFYPVAVRPDFDTALLPARLRRLFVERCFGICRVCGIAQDYSRFSARDITDYCKVLADKDQAVSEEAFHTFPVPADYVAAFNKRYFGPRTQRWKEFFAARNFPIRRAFFFRPFFGAAPSFWKEACGAECSGMEISEVARKTTQALLPDFCFPQGNIHAVLDGPFLESGPYDAIFDFHTLVHCIDVHDALAKMESMLRPGGALVLTHEINMKPSNPFHIFFADETALLKVVSAHFTRIERLDACEAEPAPHIRDFTEKQDCPDFVAWKNV
jgi:hypothetical protein